ncbi:MAG: anaerobic sulfite reductase subunit AsrB [Bacillota bacterium]|nr:anaerobic sulfite reductase subunit AsrB [Bacillota bacterium]
MIQNEYRPFLSGIKEVIRHTEEEYTFRMEYNGPVKPGQFFEVSLPRYGEAPISVSGIADGLVDFTVRKVGKVTGEIFEHHEGCSLFIRGPYGNGFDLEQYRGKELVVVAGGTGVSPVRGVVDHFARHPEECKSLTLIAGFKSPDAILFRDDFERWAETARVILTVDAAPEGSGHRVGLVTQYIPDLTLDEVSTAVAITVGPPVMMRFAAKALLERGFREENLWLSQERKMCCGLGKCGHCRVNDAYICLDGPVFNYTDGKTLVD